MKPKIMACSLLLLVAFLSCEGRRAQVKADAGLVGAWKSKLQFQSGPFAAIKDLEFMYSFNAGGTMTESSNYDAAPPVPPAYGIWKMTGPNQYEARYEFYVTRRSTSEESEAASGGWMPAGHGVFVEHITLDGDSFSSTIEYKGYDQDGKATGEGAATGSAKRLKF
ncbi:MAG TPA: hypothetical protein VFG11_07510 [Acidobacteriota bacterium]|nr:hypothetical protein [Acidobacteriota bacterium]